jgi:hypothetical protein
MAHDDAQPRSSGPELTAEYILGQIKHALADLQEITPSLTEEARQRCRVQLENMIRDFGEFIINFSPFLQADAGDLEPSQASVPRKSAPMIVATVQDVANRQTMSRFKDDVVLLLLLLRAEAGKVLHIDVHREFTRIGHPQNDGAIRTRLSRLRADGLVAAAKDEPAKPGRKAQTGRYSLTEDGRRAAEEVLAERFPGLA